MFILKCPQSATSRKRQSSVGVLLRAFFRTGTVCRPGRHLRTGSGLIREVNASKLCPLRMTGYAFPLACRLIGLR